MIRILISTVLSVASFAQEGVQKPVHGVTPAPAKPATEAPTQTPPGPAAAPESKAAEKVDKIIGKVDGAEIFESELDVMLNSLSPQQRQQIIGGGREKAIKDYLEFRLVAAKAKLEGMDKADWFLKKAQFAVNQVLVKDYLAREADLLQKREPLSEEAIKAYYESNKDAFRTPGKFSARHILVKVKAEGSSEPGLSEEKARERILECAEAFKKGGKWEELAKKYSDDSGSKDKAGLYEETTFGQFVPEFEAAVRKQEIGKLGEPVKTKYGYHLIQVETRQDGELQEFDKVKDKVKQRANIDVQEKHWKKMLAELKREIPYVVGAEAAKPAEKKKAASGRPATK